MNLDMPFAEALERNVGKSSRKRCTTTSRRRRKRKRRAAKRPRRSVMESETRSLKLRDAKRDEAAQRALRRHVRQWPRTCSSLPCLQSVVRFDLNRHEGCRSSCW